ncbi:hypothetical protein KO116_01811 [Halomonas sp. KO116]|nr:hypothetical protein KO116_01811 [Halomonas sp. KO116]
MRLVSVTWAGLRGLNILCIGTLNDRLFTLSDSESVLAIWLESTIAATFLSESKLAEMCEHRGVKKSEASEPISSV